MCRWIPVIDRHGGSMSGYAAVAWLLLVVLASVGALYGTGRLLRLPGPPREVPPYQSGVPPQEHAMSRFHVRWYVVTLLFLAFDMEMIFMYPWTLVVTDIGAKAVVEMFVFLAILLVGVGYAGREGALRWT